MVFCKYVCSCPFRSVVSYRGMECFEHGQSDLGFCKVILTPSETLCCYCLSICRKTRRNFFEYFFFRFFFCILIFRYFLLKLVGEVFHFFFKQENFWENMGKSMNFARLNPQGTRGSAKALEFFFPKLGECGLVLCQGRVIVQ